MLTHPTQDRLVALGLTGMAKALEEQRRQPDVAALAFEERLGLLVDREGHRAREQAARQPLEVRRQDDQRLYMCNAGCGTSLIPDVNQKTVGDDLHRLNRDQAWERSLLDPTVQSNNVDIA